MRFTKPTKSIGLDIGSHSVKAVQISRSGGRLRVEDVGYAILDKNQVNIDPISAAAEAVREALRPTSVGQCQITAALPGQTVVIRYPRLRNTALDHIEQAVQAEASQNIPYDLSEVFLDWSVLDEELEGDEQQLKVLLVAAKHEVIDSRLQIADAAEIEMGILSVDSLALSDAAEGCDLLRVGETVALINIGETSVSIHFAKDGISNFIRDVSWGARELIQAIAKVKQCTYDEAERILFNIDQELGGDAGTAVPPVPSIPVAAVEPEVTPESSGVDAGEDTLGLIDDPLGLDDSVKSDDPFGDNDEADSGSGSLLDPFGDEALGLSDESPVQPAPVVGSMGTVEGAVEGDLREALSVPISRLVNEIRRSFDYYEHQLYEHPVDRIILSGGAASIALLQEAISDNMGIESVIVADPTAGAIDFSRSAQEVMDQHLPAQFMVAVGLAARGMVDL